MADEKDPVADMMAIDDEAARGRELPEAELNVEAPADKKKPEHDEAGRFKAKGEKEPEAKVEEKADDKKPEPKAEERPKDTVPLATFLEKTNKLKEQLEQSEISRKQYEARLAALEAKLPKAEEPAAPDFVEDPKGYVDHQQKRVLDAIAEANKKAEATGAEAQKTAAQAAEQVQMQQFFTNLQSHEQRFIAANPDYHEALGHLRTVRAEQLRQLAPDITEAQIIDTIRTEETNLAVQLARQGRDPVQTAYNLAQTFGYKKPAAPPPADTAKLPDGGNGGGAKRLPPDQTLGSGSSANDTPYKEGETDPVDLALASLFKKRA